MFAEADLRHSYESNEKLRQAGIIVLCATQDMIIATSMAAKTLSPDSEIQRKFIVTPWNNNYPQRYCEYAKEYYSDHLLKPHEQIALFDDFKFVESETN